MDKKKNAREEIKETLKELVQDSTSHGIPRVLKSKPISMKILWALCFLASTGYCISLVINTINDFLSYDHITSVDIYFEMPALFPAITICNLNSFQTNKSIEFANKFLANMNLSKELRKFFLMNEIFDSADSVKKSYSYSLSESLIECQFNGQKCYADQFEWIFDILYGNCYRFNSGKNAYGNVTNLVKISNSGYFYGLQLEIFIGDIDYTADILKSSGYRIMINNQTHKPFISDGLDIAPGINTNIVINRLYNYRLENPYNDCKSNLNTIDAFDSDLYRAIINSNLTYKQIDCFYLCYQKQAIEKCNCYLKSYNKLTSEIPCKTIEQLTCTFAVWDKFINNDINEMCSSLCPAECDSITYSISTSFSGYPLKSYAESQILTSPVIKQRFLNQTYEQIKSSVLSVNVYYDQLGYTVTSQQAKTNLFDVISNIGGLLGLFIGISFLSFIEIIEAIYQVLSISVSSYALNKVNQKV